MDNEKKSRVIRLFGRIGRRVKFLQKPLMVLTVVGVSVHHLIKKLFFDVNYHTARMRALTGAVCLALLCTLVVIPAIADEVFDLEVEVEEINSADEATPEPEPEPEVIEEKNDGTDADDSSANQPSKDDKSNDEGNNDNANEDDKKDTVKDGDGLEYEVDDEGNIIGDNVKDLKDMAASKWLDDENFAEFFNPNASVEINPTNFPSNPTGNSYEADYGPSNKGTLEAVLKYPEGLESNQKVNPSKLIYTCVATVPLETDADATTTNTLTNAKFNLDNGYSLKAGTYKFKWKISIRGKDPDDYPDKICELESEEFTVKINKATLNDDNFNENYHFYGDVGSTNIYYAVVGGKENSTIPYEVPNASSKSAWTNTGGEINAHFEYVPIDSTGNASSYWKTPAIYYAKIVIDSARNYKTGSIPLQDKRIDVQYYPEPVTLYSFSPNILMPDGGDKKFFGNQVPDQADGVKWANSNVVLKPASGLSVSFDASPSESDILSEHTFNENDSKANPNGAQAKNMTFYKNGTKTGQFWPIGKRGDEGWKINVYSCDKNIFIDTTNPTPGYLNGKAIKPKNGGDWATHYKDNIEFSISVADAYSKLDKSTLKCYALPKGSSTPSEIDITIDPDTGNNITANGIVDTSPGKFSSGELSLYVVVKDNAGNEYKSEDTKVITIDKTPPEFYSTASKQKEIKDSDDESKRTFFIDSLQKKEILVYDQVGLQSVTVSPSVAPISIDSSDKTKVKVPLDPPPSVDTPITYEIVAKDLAGNDSTIHVIVYQADIDIDVSEKELGGSVVAHDVNGVETGNVTGAYYGYKIDGDDGISFNLNEILNKVASPKSPVNFDAKIKSARIAKAKTAGASDPEPAFTISSSAPYVVKPKPELPVGTYKAIIAVEYALVQQGSDQEIVEHSAAIPISFTVVRKELKATYVGNTEYFHAKTTYQLKDGADEDKKGAVATDSKTERWAIDSSSHQIAVKVAGFVYDQAQVIKAQDSSYQDPIPAAPVLGQRHDLAANATDTEVIPANGVAKNYYFNYVKGTMKCIRRVFPEKYGWDVEGTHGGTKELEGPNEEGWYTSAVTIKPAASNFKILEETGAHEEGVAPAETIPIKNNGDAVDGVDGFSNTGFKFFDETTGKTKYFYVHDEDTDEISGLISKQVKIDRTALHQLYTPRSTDDTAEGLVGLKAEADLPYINIDSDSWKEFLHTVTLGLYFNASKRVGINNAEEDKDVPSGIKDISYLILDEKAEDLGGKDETNPRNWNEDELDAAGTWKSVGLSTSFPIEKTDVERGYLYVRITNHAGLKTYLTPNRLIIFDTDGPKIKANYKKDKPLATSEEFEDGAEFIAEKVQFTISDSHLYKGTEDDPAIKIYKGVNIGGEPYKKIANGPDDANWASAITEELECENYGKYDKKTGVQQYTIIAKDDSGFVTIRYFTIKKPVYNIEVDDLAFDTEVYGYTRTTGKEIKQDVNYHNVDPANSDAKNLSLSITSGSEYFEVDTDGKTVRPKTGLGADVYIGELTVTYDDTYNEETNQVEKKTDKARLAFRVDKRELTAKFTGAQIKKGETPNLAGKVEVTGFIGNDWYEDTTDGKVKAEGYVHPVVNVPATLKTTTILYPTGGKAKNYNFNPVGGVLQVLSTKAEKNAQYTVTGTLSDNNWYISDITITPGPADKTTDKNEYIMASDEAGRLTMDKIYITEDTPNGLKEFYIKNKTTGEVYEKCQFSYKKDTVAPTITGVLDGNTYKSNSKEVTVQDANLARVSVNGIPQPVSAGKCVFNLKPEVKEQEFLIVAEDMAGHQTYATVTLQQEDGTGIKDEGLDPDGGLVDDEIDPEGAGTLTKKVQLVDGAPSTTFTSTSKELKSYVLNSAERQDMNEGSDANVKLRVQDLGIYPPQGDKEVAFAALGDYTVAKWLDITLWKTVGSGAETQVTSTTNPISMTITIPASIRSAVKSGKVRDFAFIRVHNGSATVLHDKDSSANTITVGSSKFSLYALAYRDVEKSSKNSSSSGGGSSSSASSSGGGGGSSSGGDGSYSSGGGGYGIETDGIYDRSPQTGDHAPILPTAIAFGLAFFGMITVIILRRRLDYEWVYVDEDGNIIEDVEIDEMN